MKKITLSLFCILCLSIFSCEKDEPIQEPTTSEEPEVPIVPINFEENLGASVTVRFFGRVVDEQNMPIQGATVLIGNTITTTDIFGIFSGTDTTAYEKFAYVTVESDGYIKGSRAVIPSVTEVNNIEIMLLKEDVIATISSGEAASVNLPNGTRVSFDGNFIRENGTVFNGQVDVILKHLSPDDENMDTMMPGMLFAQNASGDAVALETYGMLAVELRSSSGEELQLAEGSTAQITMPISVNTTNPPATIPLWYFDEEEGYWKEEGEATLQGNKYVGEVSHFTFWNYDFPYPAINLCITLVDEDGNLLPYTSLDIYSALLNETGTYGYTNASGTECGWVPKGEQLTVTTATTHCDNEPFSTTIGPFTSDTNITITVPSSQSVTEITGTFVDCSGNNVTNGYIQLFISGNSQIIPVTDGTISYTVAYCDNLQFSLKGINIGNNQVTDIFTGTLDGGATTDVGTLSSCSGFTDTDEDGVYDSFEDINGDNDLTNDDTDEDGTPNYLDADDDGDGINTADEDYDGDNDPTNDDTDGDQIPDYLDAVDVNIFDSEIIATGCDPLLFSLDEVSTQYDNSNMSFAFYETEADANAETNALTSTYEVPVTSFVVGTTIYVKVTNTITNATAIASIALVVIDTLDADNDGLTDCEEITGIDNPDTVLVPTGTSDPNDMNDPVDFTDSDGDGLTDLEETTGNDNILTPLTPNGTSDPNDACDPIETSSLVDSDNDGLTDCEEITGIDNPDTVLVPNGTTDPNDACDPIETSSLDDTDNDGLTNCEETTGIDNSATISVPTGTSDPNDMNDPVDFTDSDGDGLTDLEETTGIDNLVTTLTPTGITDPNDPCDPIETSSTVDSDNDGLTDCEETTGNDDPTTPFVPSGISDPNDMNNPIDFTDTDGDGLTDEEETTGIDNPGTPFIATGISDPNDDTSPFSNWINFSSPTVVEGSSEPIQIIVNRTGPFTGLAYSIEFELGPSSAMPGADFTGSETSFYFNMYDEFVSGIRTVPYQIIDDAIAEGVETITLNVYISDDLYGLYVGGYTFPIITIIDND